MDDVPLLPPPLPVAEPHAAMELHAPPASVTPRARLSFKAKSSQKPRAPRPRRRSSGGVGRSRGGGTPPGANVRKSQRPAKPRSLDLLPSAAWHLAPGVAAVGRRLKVHWPSEMAWFSGCVTRFDEATGLHHIAYDDGDSEEVLLAAERIEWIHPSTHGDSWVLPPDAGAPQAALAAEPAPLASPRSRMRKGSAVHAANAPWPHEGDFLWGRVKGHGWWPGRAVELAASSVYVDFFDNTSGWVQRSDCLPFEEHFDELQQSKKVPTFIRASKLARTAWNQLHKQPPAHKRRLSSEHRSPADRPSAAKRARTQAADAACGAAAAASCAVSQGVGALDGVMPASRQPVSRPRSRRSGRESSRRGRLRPAPPRGFGGSVGVLVVGGKAADVAGLARRLDELQARLSPIAAQAHEVVAAQLRTLLQPESRRVLPSSASWAAQERSRLLSQLDALGRMPHSPTAAAVPACVAALAFSEQPAVLLDTGGTLAADAPPAGAASPARVPAFEEEEAEVAVPVDGNATEESDG